MNAIKRLRKSLGITQKELSIQTGLSYAAIRSYEAGGREPGSRAMAILEDFFQVSGKYLRGEMEEGILSETMQENKYKQSVNQEISKRIKLLRKEKGLTQKQLSEVTGLGYKAIANYEIGFREPNSKAMAALEDYFQVSGKYLRGETDERISCLSNNKHFSSSELDLLYNLVHKEIMCAERLADIYDLSGKVNEDVKNELLKLAVKIIEMKEYRNERV